MAHTFIARMVVETIVEADTRAEAEQLARARFEALASEQVRVCTDITDPHLGSPMTNGMTIAESMRSRTAHRKAVLAAAPAEVRVLAAEHVGARVIEVTRPGAVVQAWRVFWTRPGYDQRFDGVYMSYAHGQYVATETSGPDALTLAGLMAEEIEGEQ